MVLSYIKIGLDDSQSKELSLLLSSVECYLLFVWKHE
jgi:hypothetical protein